MPAGSTTPKTTGIFRCAAVNAAVPQGNESAAAIITLEPVVDDRGPELGDAPAGSVTLKLTTEEAIRRFTIGQLYQVDITPAK